MTAISLPLPGNVLHTEPQTLDFDKIATFIGGNGSGKSSILKSIFDKKLDTNQYHEYKVVCFSSGQNESYSERFSSYLNTERQNKRALSLDCFYYDKSWSKLLIFLATISKDDGLVRNFLKQSGYVTESAIDEDLTTKLTFNVKVDLAYTNIVRNALEDEQNGNDDVITKTAYHHTLHNFITALIDDEYDFTNPLEVQELQLNQDVISNISFETDENSSFDSKVMFFTQASDNDYFIVKNSFKLTFIKNDDDQVLRLEDLSDGEYQLLFLYALSDLFDTEQTLFLLDEADSHLHFQNIKKLWDVFDSMRGRAITTTHLLDSISKSGISKLKVVEDGQIKPGKKLTYLMSRLSELSDINNTQFKALSLFENIVLIDDENDWDQFKLLVKRKLANTADEELLIDRKLQNFVALKCNSGYKGDENQVFGDKKIAWLERFSQFLHGQQHNTKNIFLLCDRDALSLSNIGNASCNLLIKGKKLRKYNNEKLSCHLLSWKRREIKHYLISPSALPETVDQLNRLLDLGERTKLRVGVSGDYDIEGEFNNKLATIESSVVKDLVHAHINIDGQGYCSHKTKTFIDNIPKEEISEDIVNMFNYLVENNE